MEGSVNYLRVRNWEKFQHYKGKAAPPWIKLHRDLLSNYEFNQLPELAQGRLVRLWLLAASTKNKIPKDPAWVAKQIGAKSIDLDDLLSRGWLEEFYSDSREPLALTEQNRQEENRQEQKQKQTNSRHTSVDERLVEKLLKALTDKDALTENTVWAMVRKHKLADADLAWALECATGPGVVSPSGVAVAELRKRGLAKEAA